MTNENLILEMLKQMNETLLSVQQTQVEIKQEMTEMNNDIKQVKQDVSEVKLAVASLDEMFEHCVKIQKEATDKINATLDFHRIKLLGLEQEIFH